MDPCDGIITLVASDEAKPVHVHRGVLCKSSEFFKRAMKPEWASSRKDPNTIDLHDDLVEMIVLYVEWLQEGELHIAIPLPKDDSDEERSTGASKAYTSLAEAYVFGEKIMDNSFKNLVLWKFVETHMIYQWGPDADAINVVYEGTMPGSPLRRLIADIVACTAWDHLAWLKCFDTFNRDSLADCMKAMAKLRSAPQRWPFETCFASYLEEE